MASVRVLSRLHNPHVVFSLPGIKNLGEFQKLKIVLYMDCERDEDKRIQIQVLIISFQVVKKCFFIC